MNRNIMGSLAWAAAIIGLALLATAARSQGFIDQDTATRIVTGAIGLMVAWYGNQMPKQFAPSEKARRVQRVGGWSMAISGLIYAGLWAFAPLSVALWVGCGAIIAGMAVTLGYCFWVRGKAEAA